MNLVASPRSTFLVGLVFALVGSACSGCGSASSAQRPDAAAAGTAGIAAGGHAAGGNAAGGNAAGGHAAGGNAAGGNAAGGNAAGGNAAGGNAAGGNAASGNAAGGNAAGARGGGGNSGGGQAEAGRAGQNGAGTSAGGGAGGTGGSSAGGGMAAGGSTVQGSYSTDFNLTESPISEQGVWKHTGLDWATIATAKGLAYGTQTGNGGFDDAYAYLSGFPPDQAASAVVHRDPAVSGGTTHEVEILLRWSDAPHSASGYECNFAYDGTYASIVRWNGAKSDFTVIDGAGGTGKVPGGLHDGDVVKAQIIGSVITTFVNGTQIQTTTDAVIKQGNPGIGMWRGAPSAPLDDYAFTSYVATPLSK